MKRLAVLISNKGTGTNLQAIIGGVESGKINGRITVVVSDTEEALGLDQARKHYLTKEFDFGKVLGRCFEKIRKDDTI